MKDFGFVRVAAATPVVSVAKPMENAAECLKLIEQAAGRGVQIVCFPELSITGYTCADLFQNSLLLDNAEKALLWLVQKSARFDITAIVGVPLRSGNRLYNAAVILSRGRIVAATAKSHLPEGREFYEKRWFASVAGCPDTEISLRGIKIPFGADILLDAGTFCFSVEICEDLWTVMPPSGHQALAGSHIIFNLSASDELTGKHDYVRGLVTQQSARLISAYVYSSAGFGESSTDLLFAGSAMIAENGTLLTESERFLMESHITVSDVDIEKLKHDRLFGTSFQEGGTKAFRKVSVSIPERHDQSIIYSSLKCTPFIPSAEDEQKTCSDIFNIQIQSLAVRMKHVGTSRLVIGISGGLDSTLALLVAVKTCDRIGLDRSAVIGITMPGFGTTDRTYRNALKLMETLNVEMREISITDAVLGHFKDIGHDEKVHDVTYENSQARERTQILMDVANSYSGALVVGTGDMSELALGWCTFNGDHMSMYSVNAGVPKTLVRRMVKYVADYEVDASAKVCLYDIIDTPISPELLPADRKGRISQKTEDIVGPYELHDFFLFHFVRNGFSPEKIFFMAKNAFDGVYSQEEIEKWLKTFCRRFFNQQFKRSCMPDGPKVGSVGLSPRGDWRMPSDVSPGDWVSF